MSGVPFMKTTSGYSFTACSSFVRTSCERQRASVGPATRSAAAAVWGGTRDARDVEGVRNDEESCP